MLLFRNIVSNLRHVLLLPAHSVSNRDRFALLHMIVEEMTNEAGSFIGEIMVRVVGWELWAVGSTPDGCRHLESSPLSLRRLRHMRACWSPVAAVPSAGVSCNGAYHLVRTGETLFSIAARYGTTPYRIAVCNGLRSYTVYVGQTLLIPTGRPYRRGAMDGPTLPVDGRTAPMPACDDP